MHRIKTAALHTTLSGLTALLVVACTNDSATAEDSSWWTPQISNTWQWQLTGTINTHYSVDVYDIDLFESSTALIDQLHADGRKVVCYFSAGSYEPYRDDSNQFLPTELGNPLAGFADEKWLDIRSPNVRDIMVARLDLAKQKGCDGVEPDNVDGYSNSSGFDFTASDQLDFNQFLAEQSHQRGLAVGLKNDLEQVAELVNFFDFSVNEQCHEYNECGMLKPFIDAGKPVFNAEYAVQYVNDSVALCNAAQAANFRTLILPEDLDNSFRINCD